jgi:co-chaperonin GroES (HSP10)
MLKAVTTKPRTEKAGDIQATGYYVAIKIWVRPEKIGSIYTATVTQQEDKYSHPVGEVVSIGPDAFKGDAYTSGAWCKIGDHVLFDRGAAQALNYDGQALAFIPDNKIVAVVPDPMKFLKINALETTRR